MTLRGLITRMSQSSSSTKLNSQDWGWVAVNIGMGIGAGIVFLPVQAGIVGLWTFLLAIAVAYPALYLFQRLFVNTLIAARTANDYPEIISEYLGRKWGVGLGFIYFIMLIIWLFVYSQTITNDSASYLHTAGVTEGLLSSNPLYSLGIIALLVFVAFISKKLLLNLSKLLVIIVLLTLILLSLLIIRDWDFSNIQKVLSCWNLIRNAIITLPFAMTSILFLQSLSPMVIYVRSQHKNKETARIKAIKIMNRSFFILAGIVFFFAFSCTMAINTREAHQAVIENTSFLAIMAKVIPGILVPAMGVILDICAVMTSFFGVLLGFHEACVGLSISIFMKNKSREHINMQKLSGCVIGFIVLVAWGSTLLNVPILYFTSICSPIFAIIGCFIPVILVYRSDQLKKYRGIQSFIVILTGILLVISPFLAFLK